ncbi:MAG: DNA repair protein RecN, partial [Fimbriimonas ginsengisoli]|nr:DNA repair protein RecN [Fimbriimonas ginsengisoli]
LDLLKFQVKEIEEAVLKPGEFAEMETRLSRLQNAERLAQTLGTSLDTLANREGSASEAIGGSIRSLEEAVKWDPALEQALATLREARYSLEEGTRLLRASLDSLDADPETLAHVADRLDALRRLRRKYGEDEDAILAFLQTAKAELDLLEDAEADEESLAADTERLETELGERAQELSSLRHAQEPRFAAVAGREIRELAMDHAVFEVRIEGKAVDAGGLDRVEFFFSANPGEPPRPLAKIASGGEVSRLMLALKGVLAGRAGVPTLIFDEVGSGLGGQTATVVARKLERLAERYQVIVISHLPQIAARAGTHWRIEKRAVGGRTETVLSLLSQPERLEEVARMLAGD